MPEAKLGGDELDEFALLAGESVHDGAFCDDELGEFGMVCREDLPVGDVGGEEGVDPRVGGWLAAEDGGGEHGGVFSGGVGEERLMEGVEIFGGLPPDAKCATGHGAGTGLGGFHG